MSSAWVASTGPAPDHANPIPYPRGRRCIAFDQMLYGFCRYVKHRLELLGFRVHCFSNVHETLLTMLKDECIVVTLDTAYASRGTGVKIKLPYMIRANSGRLKRRTYEEWWTMLARSLASLRG